MNTTRKGFLATLGALVAAPFVTKPSGPRVTMTEHANSVYVEEERIRRRFEAGYNSRRNLVDQFGKSRIPFGPARSPGYSGILPPV